MVFVFIDDVFKKVLLVILIVVGFDFKLLVKVFMYYVVVGKLSLLDLKFGKLIMVVGVDLMVIKVNGVVLIDGYLVLVGNVQVMNGVIYVMGDVLILF